MSDDKNIKKKGFAGLSDLASDVGDQDSGAKPGQSEKSAPTPEPLEPSQPTQPTEQTQIPTSTSTSSGSSQDQEPQPVIQRTDSSGGSNAGWWILGGIGLIILMAWCSNINDDYSTSSSNQDSYSSQSTGTTSPSTDVPDVAEERYVKPPVGTTTILSLPQARWLGRESIRIETMRDLVDTEEGIAEFNRIIDDFNLRLGQAYDDVWEQARQDVEADNDEIVLEAILDAANMGRMKMNKEAQNYLLGLGHSPGPIDGIYGPQTYNAVLAFEKDAGLTQDGWIDQDLIIALRKEASTDISNDPKQDNPSSSNKSQDSNLISDIVQQSTNYFTRGSHQDVVIRLQGTPDNIDTYEASDYELWSYGYDKVKISISTGRVLAWDNNSKTLKVKLIRGGNISSDLYYTRGSHQDDVIRLQGTPDEIDIYKASGYELWSYGYDKVKISISTKRVLEWENRSSVLKVR